VVGLDVVVAERSCLLLGEDDDLTRSLREALEHSCEG
jgi:hypothetical protein